MKELKELDIVWSLLDEGLQNSPFYIFNQTNYASMELSYWRKILPRNEKTPRVMMEDGSSSKKFRFIAYYFDGIIRVTAERCDKVFNIADPNVTNNIVKFLKSELNAHLSICKMGIAAPPYKWNS